MEALPWFWIWVILAAVLFVGEMLTLSFFLLPFAVGAALAAITGALGLDLLWQFIVFVVSSVICLFAMRPLAKRLTRKGEDVKVGVERLVGVEGKVVEGQSGAGEFRVVVQGEPWNASAESAARLEPGTAVVVLAVKSNSLLVRAL